MSENNIFDDENGGRRKGYSSKQPSIVGGVEFTEILNESVNHRKGEISLWRAVVMQALADASNRVNKMEMKLEKARAIAWLSGNSKDFNEVCALAGLDPVMIKEKARHLIWEEREIGKRKRVRQKRHRYGYIKFLNNKADKKLTGLTPKFENNVVSLFKK